MRHRMMALAGLAIALLALVLPASSVAAKPVIQEHSNFSDTFPSNFCGIEGTSVVKGVESFTLYADGTFRDTLNLREVFTATGSGKSVQFQATQQVTGNDTPIENGDGTITFVRTFKGLPEKLKIPNGTVLSRDAGVVTFTNTFDAETGELISQVISDEHGPHPELHSDFELFCDLVVPVLS
jgi:hypothetical protein